MLGIISQSRAAFYWMRQCAMEVRQWQQLAQESAWKGASLAIVGNAGYLSQLEQGHRLDSFDLVLRMNNFRTQGFESQVGSRTDIVVSTFYRDVNLDRDEFRSAKYLLASVPNNWCRDHEHRVQHVHGVDITHALISLGRDLVYAPTWDDFLGWRTQIGAYPTTGATILLGLVPQLASVLRSVYVTGFSFFEGAAHYFDAKKVDPVNHAPSRERTLVASVLAPYLASGFVQCDPQLSAVFQAIGGNSRAA